MAKTGLFGFGYINESIFYSKLSDLLGRDVTAQDKQLIHNTVQRQLEDGCLEYYACDGQGTVSVSSSAPRSAKAILAKSVFTGLYDRQNQQILAYVCQQAGGKWSSVYVGARPAVFGIVSSYHIGYLNFRNFAQANDFICALHEVLLPGEQWSFPRSEENPALLRHSTKYQILESYLRHTFAKLMLEYKTPDSDNYGKIVFSQDKRYCYFNTGLLTRYAQDLYLTGEVSGLREDGIFTCNNPKFVDSKITLVKTYGFAQRDIDPGPGTASFYRKVSDIVYDPTLTIDFTQSKLEHIIDDGIRRGRIPRKYTVTQSGQPVPSWSLAQMLHNSIKTACMLAQRDYKYVVPQYRPAGVEYVGGKRICYEGQIQFLMPIYLSADYISPPDFALVLSRRDGFYVPETILLLPWAYTNARILCKPDNSWLNPNAISAEDLLTAEDDEEESFDAQPAEIPAESAALPAEPAPVEPAKTPVQKEPEPAPKEATQPVEPKPAEKAPAAELQAGALCTFLPTERTASRGVRGRIDGTDAVGTVSRAKLGGRTPKDLLGQVVLVRVDGKSRTGEGYQLSLVEAPDAPAEAPAAASEHQDSLPAENVPETPCSAPEETPAVETVPAAEESAPEADSPLGKVVAMRFTGTTAAKAVKCESENGLFGTVSAKRLSGHKALEFHGLTAQVRILSQNTCGDSYQCELAEPVDDILARRTAAPTEKKPVSPAKKPAAPAKSGWAWADPTNLFSQRPMVVENFRDLAVGQRYNATVRDLMPYGVFVDIGYAGGNVLLHKSQFAEGAKLSVGDVITVWIHALDVKNEKVQVTMIRPD